jgi:flagellar assembly factor FliW
MADTQEIDTRLGRQVVSLDKVIHFPRGIIGFEDRKDFTLLQIRPDAPFLVLQSMEEPGLGLLVADPYSFLTEYNIKVGDAEQKILQIKSREDLAVLVTVSIPHGRPEEIFLSLTGPILVNHDARVGMQVPQTDLSGPAKIRLRADDMAPSNEA